LSSSHIWITSSSRAGCLGGEKTSNPLFSDRRTSRPSRREVYPPVGERDGKASRRSRNVCGRAFRCVRSLSKGSRRQTRHVDGRRRNIRWRRKAAILPSLDDWERAYLHHRRLNRRIAKTKVVQMMTPNQHPLSFFLPLPSLHRLPSHIHLRDGWGEGFGVWGLVCGGRDQRGAGVAPAPWRLCPTWNRPVPQE
jgi:hypothetical protein